MQNLIIIQYTFFATRFCYWSKIFPSGTTRFLCLIKLLFVINFPHSISLTTDGLFLADFMMTSSNGNIFRVTGHLGGEFTGEFPAQRPVTRSFDVFFDLHPNKRLSKQWWGWWFETPPCPLRRHRNVHVAKISHLCLIASLCISPIVIVPFHWYRSLIHRHVFIHPFGFL